ncbi:MAG: GNAT family N-acetyltransferase, partial [Pseudobdellovibrionaceae bacterium]
MINLQKPKDYYFREAQIEDIPHLKLIRDNVRENRLVSASIGEAEYRRALFDDGKGWICIFQNKIVGFSCSRLKQQDVWALFIDSNHEGKGIGNYLMHLLENWMFEKGCSQIVLSTDPQTRAEKLYRKRNWKETAVLPNKEVEFVLRHPRVICETERLILRKITDNDLEAFYKILSDPEVMKFSVYGPHNHEETQRFIEGTKKRYSRDGVA